MTFNFTLRTVLIIILAITACSNVSSQACTSTLVGGTVSASITTVCPEVFFGISVNGSTTGTGLTYQWQSSPNNLNWVDMAGFINPGLSTTQTASLYYRRKIICNAGGSNFSNSILVNLNSFGNCYCTPSTTGCVAGYSITNVSFSTINNSSACSVNGYFNYSGTVAAPGIMQGSWQPISVTVSSGSSAKYVHCFIDYNQNGLFDPKEYTLLTTTSGNIYSGYIKVPFNAKPGTTRMRLAHNASISYSSTCFPSPSSETEDYSINITANTSGAKGFVIYVKQTAIGSTNTGMTWANALTNARRAIEIATAGDTIKVAKGIFYTGSGYPNGFILQDSLVMLGGYPNTGTPADVDRNVGLNPTILNGLSSGSIYNYHVVYATGNINESILDGFILENGGYTGSALSQNRGGGISIENGANIKVKNCVLRNNYIYTNGTAIAIFQSSPKFYNCIVEKNNGFYNNILIEKNSNPIFYNVLVSNNKGGQLMQVDSSGASFRNCTFANNLLESGITKAVNKSHLDFKNSISYFNGVNNASFQQTSYDSLDVYVDSSTVSFSNSLTQVNNQGTNLILGAQPKFRDTASVTGPDGLYFTADDGFNLINPCSPAINTGSNADAAGITTDITGSPRIFGSAVDLGAYEVQANRLSIPKVLYVNAGATGLNNGTSWANAFTDLHRALLSCSDTIRLATGTYAPFKTSYSQPYWFENGRIILGGYPATGNPTDANRNPSLHPTNISGATNTSFRENTIVRGLNLDSTSIVDGLNFTNSGNTDFRREYGSVFYSNCNNPIIRNSIFMSCYRTTFLGRKNNNPLLQDCIFQDNILPDNSYTLELIVLEKSNKTRFKNCTFRNNILVTSTSITGAFGKIISIDNSNPLFDSCSFTRNQAAGVYNNNSNPVFTNTQFINNYAGDRTTDLRNVNSNPTFTNCLFRDSAWSSPSALYGGIMNNYISNPVFTNCQFYNGRVVYYGGVAYNDSSLAQFTNCVFSNCANSFYNTNSSNILLNNCINTGSPSIGNSTPASFMHNVKSNPVINNCVVVNSATSSQGVIFNDPNSFPQINNSIFWKNFQTAVADTAVLKSRIDIKNSIAGQTTARNSMFEFYDGGTANNNTTGIDPRFVDYTNPMGPDSVWFTADDGLRLCTCSPAINSGDNNFVTTTIDITNAPRIFNIIADRGAYELQGAISAYLSKTYFVNTTAPGNNSGTSWTNAYTSLRSALANSCADSIKIAAGIYKPAFQNRDSVFYINRNMFILGSYSSTNPVDTNRDVDLFPTIISGDIGTINDSTDNSFGLIKVFYTDSLLIDGVVIRDANRNILSTINQSAFSGGYIQNLLLRNCRFYKNLTNNVGGAVSLFAIKNFDFQKTVFRQNKAVNGAAFYSNNTGITKRLVNCIFEKNEADYAGGGFYTAESDIAFINCLFNNNFARVGAGMYLQNNPDVLVNNCTFSNNKLTQGGYQGGGIYSAGASFIGGGAGPFIGNCIFTGNSALSQTSQGTYQDIFYDKNGYPPSGGYVELRIHHSAVSTFPIYYSGGGNISPGLISYKNENSSMGADGKWFTADDGLALSICSDGIDTGQNLTAGFATDLAGKNRIFNNTVDMGAYEFNGTPEWTRLLNFPNDSLTATEEITDTEGWTHYYKDCFYLMSVRKGGQNIGTIGDGTFSVKLHTTPAYGSGFGTDLSAATYVSPGVSWKVMNRWWKVIPSNQPTDSIQVKFPYTITDFNDVRGSNPAITTHQQMVFYKNDGQYNALDINVPLSAFHQYFNAAVPTKTSWAFSATDTIFQANYFIQSFSGGGGGGGTGTNGGALPVTIISLSANGVNNSAIKLHWQVENQVNVWKYVIERSSNGRNFDVIGEIPAIPVTRYSFLDINVVPDLKYYYRLRPVDVNARQTLSYVVTAKLNGDVQTSIALFPNPAKTEFYIDAKGFGINEQVTITIVTAGGKVCFVKEDYVNNNFIYRVNTAALPGGVYNVSITSATKKISQKLVIAR